MQRHEPRATASVLRWARRAADRGTPWSWRVDGILAGLVALAVLITRALHASRYLYTVDSVLFSLALDDYDPMALRPHPPGYPLFIAAGALLRPIFVEANTTWVALSILMSMAAAVFLYGFVREVSSRRGALVAATLFSAAPVFFFNGVIALSYTAEAAASVGLAWAAWRTHSVPTPRRSMVLGFAWSAAVGVRPSLFLFLSPLVAYALFGPPRTFPEVRRRVLVAGGSAAAATLLWLVPTVLASGGWSEWSRAIAFQNHYVLFANTIFNGGPAALADHARRLSYFLRFETAVILPLLLLVSFGAALVAARGARWNASWPKGAGRFALAWALPSLLFYLLIFDGWDRGPLGYVLVLLPVVYAMFGIVADSLLRWVESPPEVAWRRWAFALAVPILLSPLPTLANQSGELIDQQAKAHDDWADGWAKIRDQYPPNETALLVWYSWAHVKWYFPEYLSWVYFPSFVVPSEPDWSFWWQMQNRTDDARFIEAYERGPHNVTHDVPAWVRTIVIMDFQLAGENGADRRLLADVDVEEGHADGWRLLLFHPTADRTTIQSYVKPAYRS